MALSLSRPWASTQNFRSAGAGAHIAGASPHLGTRRVDNRLLNPEYTNEYAAYTVEANPGICATFADQIACDAQVDNCKWYVDGATSVPTSKSRSRTKRSSLATRPASISTCSTQTRARTSARRASPLKRRTTKTSSSSAIRDASTTPCARDTRSPPASVLGLQRHRRSKLDVPRYERDVRKDCVTIGFSSTNFIVHCGGACATIPCGTFLEVHRVDDPEILADVRIAPKDAFTSGYRTMTMPLRYKARTIESCAEANMNSGGYSGRGKRNRRARKSFYNVPHVRLTQRAGVLPTRLVDK